jgi:hypothetical protein
MSRLTRNAGVEQPVSIRATETQSNVRRVPRTPRSGLSKPLNSLLLEAREIEAIATGSDRLQAYRISRILIGALLDAGFTATAVAVCLGTTNGSVLNRAERNGVLRLSTIRILTGLPADDEVLMSLAPVSRGELDEPVYRAVELVRALGITTTADGS